MISPSVVLTMATSLIILVPSPASLHGIRRNDLDAFNSHALDRTVRPFGRRGRDLFQHVVAFDEFAEGRVLVIQEPRLAVADEELAAGGIRVRRAGHGQRAAQMRLVVELSFDRVAGSALAPDTFFAVVLRVGIAA